MAKAQEMIDNASTASGPGLSSKRCVAYTLLSYDTARVAGNLGQKTQHQPCVSLQHPCKWKDTGVDCVQNLGSVLHSSKTAVIRTLFRFVWRALAGDQ